MTRIEPCPADRYLILAPHPDDETLSAGGLIQGAIRMGAQIKVIYLTNGEHNLISAMLYYRRPFLSRSDFEGLGGVRRKEALNAAKVLGLKEESLHFLGYPDLGMLQMRNTSQGVKVISDIRDIFHGYEPTHIVFPDGSDGHADHRAVFFYLLEALRGVNFLGKVRLLGYRVHRPLKAKPIESGEATYQLGVEEREIKRRAILCYRSQTAYRKRFLLSFASSLERFLEPRPPLEKRLVFTANNM